MEHPPISSLHEPPTSIHDESQPPLPTRAKRLSREERAARRPAPTGSVQETQGQEGSSTSGQQRGTQPAASTEQQDPQELPGRPLQEETSYEGANRSSHRHQHPRHSNIRPGHTSEPSGAATAVRELEPTSTAEPRSGQHHATSHPATHPRHGHKNGASRDSRRAGDFRHNNRRERNAAHPTHQQPSRNHPRFRERPEMYDEDEGDNLTIELDLSDPRVVRISELQRMNMEQLLQFARKLGLELSSSSLPKSQIVFEIVKMLSQSPDEIIVGEGTLEVLPDGYGFLRSPIYNYLCSVEDIYVSPTQVRRLDLRKGDTIIGTIRSPKEKEKFFALAKVERINGKFPSEIKERMLFENLTPLYPQERLVMETERSKYTGRVIDLAAPVGKGQRGMIVAPPKSGKTLILQQIANSIATNNPEVKLIMLLIDERPEEVTDMMRTVKGEVVASTFDESPERHVQVAEMVIEKARRLVEVGYDVVILLDSLTRLARAYNTVQPHSGKILSGGVDANALHKPKRFFGAARNVEEGGSLTIIASAMVETGSRMDEVIFEEFKGTGNMEVVLDRRLADRRVWPAIDIIRSGTRKEDLLYHPHEQERIYTFRQAIADLSPLDAMNLLLGRLKKTASNVEFLLSLKE